MTKKAAKKSTAKKKAAKKAPSKAAGTKGDLQAIKDLGKANDKLKAELHKTIVGMDNVIEETLIAIFSKGHDAKNYLGIKYCSTGKKASENPESEWVYRRCYTYCILNKCDALG